MNNKMKKFNINLDNWLMYTYVREKLDDYHARIKDNYYAIRGGIRSLKYWLPIIWKDRDWDYWHIYNILTYKIEQTAFCMHRNNRFVGTYRSVEKMLLCSRLIELIQDEVYQTEYFDYHESNMRFEELPEDHKAYDNAHSEKLYEMHVDEISESFDEYFAKYPRQYKIAVAELDADSTKQRIAMQIGMQNHKRCKNLMYRLVQENIEQWWD